MWFQSLGRHLSGSGVEIFHGGQGENLNIGFVWTPGSGSCVCVCAYMYACVRINACMCVWDCVNARVHVCVSVSVCMCMFIDHKCNRPQDLYTCMRDYTKLEGQTVYSPRVL